MNALHIPLVPAPAPSAPQWTKFGVSRNGRPRTGDWPEGHWSKNRRPMDLKRAN